MGDVRAEGGNTDEWVRIEWNEENGWGFTSKISDLWLVQVHGRPEAK